MIPTKEDLKEVGLNLLLYQFADKKNVKGLLGSYLTEVTKLDQEQFTLVDSFNVDDASGIYLDYIGKLVGENREQDNDDDYRERIKIRLLINNSKGTPNEILDILSSLTQTENVRTWEHPPVSYLIYTDGNNATVRTLDALKKSSPITSEVMLVVDTTRNGFYGGELLPNYQNDPKQSILGELLQQFDFMVNENNDFIVNEDGDNFILLAGGGGGISYYGKLTELIGNK